MTIYPNVPNVPGVPPIPRNPLAAPFSLILLTEDLIALLGGTFGPQWGLFLNGAPVVTADNVVSFDYKQDWQIATYPIEQGGFESYDKVSTPFDVRIRFSAGGDETTRQALLDSIAAAAQSFDLFDAATPEEVYLNVNINHYDYRRTSTNGVGLIAVDVWCTEIRVTATTQFSNTQQPSGASPVSGGNPQAVTPTPSQSAAAVDVIAARGGGDLSGGGGGGGGW